MSHYLDHHPKCDLITYTEIKLQFPIWNTVNLLDTDCLQIRCRQYFYYAQHTHECLIRKSFIVKAVNEIQYCYPLQ